MVFGDRFNCIGSFDLLTGLYGPSSKAVSYESGLSREVSLYIKLEHLI